MKKRKPNYLYKIFLETIPLIIGVILTAILWKHNVLLSVLFIIIIIVVLEVKYQPGDFQTLLYGLVAGFIIEVTGNYIIGYQQFTNPNFLGIPIWLPVAWAYGFMVMKRIGVIIYKSNKRLPL